MIKKIALLLVLVCGLPAVLLAQSFKLMRFDEDYSNLKTDSSNSFYHSLKFIPLSKSRDTYLTLGGEARYEHVGRYNENWLSGQGYNNSFLQRYSIHGNLHWGTRLRFFAQLNSALEGGSKYGPSPVDEDQLAVQNLFAEYMAWQWGNGKSLSFRVGRQELNYGAGRLISVREGPNVRLYFTGAKAMYRSPKFTVDGFVMMADNVNPGVFDNRATRQANLWGAYSSLIIPRSGNFDFYYLGYNRHNARFEEGNANELRHTLATRYWKNGGGFIYNLEAAYQFGSFGKGNISAWTAAIEMGYVFDKLAGKPSINLRNDYISGDSKRGDGNLQTFNPLYPKGGYFGFNPLIGPANLIDLHPYATISLNSRWGLQADVVYNWRYSTQDGIYHPSGNFNTAGSASSNRFIGTTYLLSSEYRFGNFFTLSGGAQYFNRGQFIRDIVQPSDNSWFYNLQFTFKF